MQESSPHLFTFKNKKKLKIKDIYNAMMFPLKDKIFFFTHLDDNGTILYSFDVKKCNSKRYFFDFVVTYFYFAGNGFFVNNYKLNDESENRKYFFVLY